MEPPPRTVGWASNLQALTWLLWFGAGTVVGGVMLALDEWRLHRTRPKPEDVRAYADHLVVLHGQEAFRINGDAMYEARSAKEFDRYHFLKKVSGELVRRFFEPNPFDHLPSAAAYERRERPEDA